MLRLINLLIFIIFGALASNAQNGSFSPEMVVGNRSITYQYYIYFLIECLSVVFIISQI
mgnify:CR=1 FL=1